MKILIATDCNRYNLGGVTASIFALCTGLRRCGHEVKTLSLSNCNRSFQDGDDYYIRSFPAFFYQDLRMSFAMKDPYINELAKWEPDVIHLQSEGSAERMAIKIKKRCGSPMVMTCHTDYAYFVFGRFRSFPPVKTFMSFSGKRIFRHAELVTVPSEKATGFPMLSTTYDRLSVVPNGIVLDRFNRQLLKPEAAELRKSLGISSGTVVLTVISRLSKEKNIQEIITYLPGLLKSGTDVKLLIVGDGPDRKHLEKLTEQLGLDDMVIFTGRISSDEVGRYFAATDIYVSASQFEVHSISYLEALANGLPMLCHADESLTGVLEHGVNGLIYNSREEFTDYAIMMITDTGLRKKMGQASSERSLDFSCEHIAGLMTDIYGKAIQRNEKNKADNIR